MSDTPSPPRPRGCLGFLFAAISSLGFAIGCLGLLFTGTLVALAVFGGTQWAAPALAGDKIAHIDLEGLITGESLVSFTGTGESMVQRLKSELDAAVKADAVKAIVVRVNSPGGEITASDTLYHAIAEADKKKPVVVFLDAMAASGGYYAACGGREIIAHETSLTGSIGVIIQTMNVADLMAKVGVKSSVTKSGEFKDILSMSREPTEAERALLQGMVDESYAKFLGIVSASRKLPEETLRNGIADGRIISGAKARELGLADANGYIEDAYTRARELGKAPDAEVMKMRSQLGFLSLLSTEAGARAKNAGRVEIDISERLLPRVRPGVHYLLPTWLAE